MDSLKVGDVVFTSNGWDVISALDVHNNVFGIYELVLENADKIFVTGNHPVLTHSGWKRVEDLRANDSLYFYDNLFGKFKNIRIVGKNWHLINLTVYSLRTNFGSDFLVEGIVFKQ
ncbi:MAG: hypothetical protein ACP5OZ_05020 [Candidatus Woesearchaeota archaeon]